MKCRLTILLPVLVSLILVMSGCSQPGTPDYLVGAVRLDVVGSCDEACALLEQALADTGSEFHLFGSGPRGYSLMRLNTVIPWKVTRLPVGDWNLQLNVRDATGNVLLEGSNAVEVRPGITNQASFIVSVPSQANQVSSPVFSPAPGIITSDQSISLTCTTSGAVVYYTIDGSTPDASSTRYAAPFTLAGGSTVKAIALKNGMTPSAVNQATYSFVPQQVAAPFFTGSERLFTDTASVELACATEGALLYYTTDGSTPTADSIPYHAPLVLTDTTTLKVVAIKDGWQDSTVAEATYTKLARTATPVISPPGTEFSSSQEILITCATPSAAIHYTTDGSIPSVASTLYTDSIWLTASTVVKAIAIADGMAESLVVTGNYALRTTVADPVFTPEPIAGGFNSAQSVEISCPTEGADLYYTIVFGDASPLDPSSAGTRYTGPIAIPETATIKVIAIKDGWNDSVVVTKNYIINGSIIIEF